MLQIHLHTEYLVQMLRHVLGRIYRAVLTAGTTEAHHQVTESSFHESLDVRIYQGRSMFSEREDFTVFFQETDHRLIQSAKRFVLVIFARIVYTSTIEYIATSIASWVIRNTLLE